MRRRIYLTLILATATILLVSLVEARKPILQLHNLIPPSIPSKSR